MKAKRKTVEAMPSIHIREVRKAGAIPGIESVLLRNGGLSEGVGLIWRDTSFGGQRAYFQCPLCFRSADSLYASPYLACRQCHGLAYHSENLTKLWRKNEKLLKLQSRAGMDTSRFPRPMPPKPKWQRWHTYLRTRQAIREAEQDFCAAWMAARGMAAAIQGKVLKNNQNKSKRARHGRA
jgi:hypothetical protein